MHASPSILNFDLPGSRLLDFPEESLHRRFLDRKVLLQRAIQELPQPFPHQTASPVTDAFICHAHGEPCCERWTTREFAPLLRQAGIRVYLDATDCGPGASLTDFMDLIHTVQWTLVIATPLLYQKSLPGSPSTVAREMQRIRERIRTRGVKDGVIPVLLAGDEQTSLPPFLSDRVYVDLRNPATYHAQIFSLLMKMHGCLNDDRLQQWKYAIEDGRPLWS